MSTPLDSVWSIVGTQKKSVEGRRKGEGVAGEGMRTQFLTAVSSSSARIELNFITNLLLLMFGLFPVFSCQQQCWADHLHPGCLSPMTSSG